MADPSSDENGTAGDEVNFLVDEYKILQDKIDKIGAFRVTIKGWAVTVAVAALAAISSGKGLSPTTTAIALTFLLGWFFWFEREQVHLGWKFNGRVRHIEIQIEKRRRAMGISVAFSSPNIARSLFGGKRRKDLIGQEFENRVLEKARIWVNDQFRLARKSDLLFYLTLSVATWIIVLINGSVQPSQPTAIHNTINVPTQLTKPQSIPVPSATPAEHSKGGGK